MVEAQSPWRIKMNWKKLKVISLTSYPPFFHIKKKKKRLQFAYYEIILEEQ